MKGNKWYDKSDAMVDYFDTAYYVDINIGKWNKPYVFTGGKSDESGMTKHEIQIALQI